jgi:integrase
MATFKFILRNEKSNKPTSINLVCLLPHKKRLRMATHLKIEPKNWDGKKQQVRNKVEVAVLRDEINSELAKIRSFAEKTFISLQNENNLTPKALKHKFDVFFGKVTEKGQKKLSFYTFIDLFIDRAESRVSKSTLGTYKRTQELLKEFDVKNNNTLEFEDINIDFYNNFMSFLDSLGHNANTKGKQIKNLKTFMNAAVDEGYTNYIGHKHKYFKVTKEASFDIYLTIEELKSIEDLKYPLNSTKDLARDWFLIGSYTGQRVSDWNKISLNNLFDLDGLQVIKLKQTKTNTDVVIPLHPVIKRILKKRKGVFPKSLSEQTINKIIKEIANEADIVELISQKNNQPKYQLIATHTARRSFCTNAYKSGMDSLAIMQLSGHKTEKSFLTYIKIRKEEFAKRIANHAFFK